MSERQSGTNSPRAAPAFSATILSAMLTSAVGLAIAGGGAFALARAIRRYSATTAAAAAAAAAGARRPPPAVEEKTSLSNFSVAYTRHAHLQLEVLFDRNVVAGVVEYDVAATTTSSQPARSLVLDTNGLAIKSAQVWKHGVFAPAAYELAAVHPVFGQALSIDLGEEARPEHRVRIEFETTEQSTALQFLTPEQTASKSRPFLFSQSQAIHARSFFPCQDAPAVKFTYNAVVRCPKDLVVVMSASPKSSEPGEYNFEQSTPVCAYLVSIVCGQLKSADISPRVRVWAEPSVIDAARHEFEDTEKYLSTAESLCGPYVWGRYDMVVLPSSFPYGGMENPQMTTLTPSLLAGDKSLADVVVHEIMHSWSGNLVTNATWSDFWMNEGFTVFGERRVIQKLYGRERANLHRVLGMRELAADIARQGSTHPFTRLHIPMDGIDPDDSFSKVPYEKGAAFLEHLESLVGSEEAFEGFLKKYYARFALGCVRNEELRALLSKEFPNVTVPDWEEWVNGTGMPPCPQPTSKLAERAEDAADEWVATLKVPTVCGDVASWSTPEKCLLLDRLGNAAPVPRALLESVEGAWQLNQVRNAEIKFRWIKLLLQSEAPVAQSSKDLTVVFLTTYGRMKYVRPLYRALAQVDAPLAKATFAAHRKELHSIAEKMVERDLQNF